MDSKYDLEDRGEEIDMGDMYISSGLAIVDTKDGHHNKTDMSGPPPTYKEIVGDTENKI